MSEKLQSMEEQVLALERRLATLEAGSSGGPLPCGSAESTRKSLDSYEAVVMQRLDEARSRMLAEAGDVETMRTDRDAARSEVARLRKENDQLRYRVKHLIKNLNAAEAKTSS
jgi:polyhydroxyalkanoate synthesis regulator phasin